VAGVLPQLQTLLLLDVSLVNRYAWVVPVHEYWVGLQLWGSQNLN
jgi:hypothetical protein